MPFWSRDTAQRPEWAAKLSGADQRSLTRDIDRLLTSHGVSFEWTDVGLRIESPDGHYTIAALERLANLYRNATTVDRIALIDRHFKSILAPQEIPRRWEDARLLVKPGIRPRASLDHDEPWPEVSRTLTDELLGVLILDLPDEGIWISPAQLADWNIPAGNAWDAALRNVQAERMLGERRTPLPGGGELRAMFGATRFGAARALELDRYFESPAPLGALLSVPAQNLAIFHVISNAESFARARETLASVGARMFNEEEDDPLSPFVHWWWEGAWTAITYADADGVIREKLPDELLAVGQQADLPTTGQEN